MAGEKKRKPKGSEGSASGGGGGGNLRLSTDPRSERRFEPKAGGSAIASVVAMSLGAVALGAGVYGQWLRAEELGAHPYAPYLMLGGAIVLLAVGLFGQKVAKPIRVGDAGVGPEKDANDVERLEWRDVDRVLFSGGVLTLQGQGTTVSIPVQTHGPAAARALREAKNRIPKKVEVEDGAIPAPEDADGQVLPLEKPQLAGEYCKASGKPIAFEKDARLCGRCGETYHKDSVPPRCLTCDARL